MRRFFIIDRVISRLHEMMGLLFAHKVSPLEIEKMNFRQLRYWSNWTKGINKQQADYLESIKNQNA